MNVSGVEVEVYYTTSSWPATTIVPTGKDGRPVTFIDPVDTAEFARCTRCWLGIPNSEKIIAEHATAHF